MMRGVGLMGVFGLCCLGGSERFCQAQADPKPAGSLDASFFSARGVEPVWDQEPTIHKLSVQPDGAVLISGTFDQIQDAARVSLARVWPNGSLDRLFVSPGVLTLYNYVRDLILEPDGKIVIAANADGLLRLEAMGNLDPDFDGQLKNGASAVVRLPSGEYLVGTYVEPAPTAAGYGIVLMNAQGRPSTQWSTDYRSAKAVSFLLLSPDGRTVVVDGVAALSLEQAGANVRYLSNSLPTDFWPNCGVFQTDGKLLLGNSGAAPGDYNTNATLSRPLVRLNADLRPDASFSRPLTIGVGPLEGGRDQLRIDAVTVQPDGKILIAGFFTRVNGEPRPLLARLQPDGELDGEFQPDIEVNPGADIDLLQMISAMSLSTDGRLVIGGIFSRINGLPCATLARLHTKGETSGGVVAFAQPVYYGWETNGSIDVSVLRFGPTNHQVSVYYEAPDLAPVIPAPAPQRGLLVFRAGETKRTLSLAIQDNRFLDGNHSFHLRLSNPRGGAVLTGTPETKITIYDDEQPGRPGSVDLSFPQIEVPGAVYGFDLLAVEPDGAVLLTTSIAVDFYNSQLRLLRCDSNGVIDPAFNPAIDGNIKAGFPDPATGSILIVGNFSTVNGQARSNVARLNHDGSLDESFPTVPISPAQWISGAVLQPDSGRLVLYGPFTSFGNMERHGVVRLLDDGRVDPQLDTSAAYWISRLDAVAPQPGGKLILAGNFNPDGQMLARLNSDGSRDASFVPPAFKYNWGVTSLHCQPDGKVLVGGDLEVADGRTARLIRLSTDGSLDTTFWADVPASYYGSSVILQPDGKIIVGGTWLLNPDGSRDYSYFTGESSDNVTGVLLLPSGNLMVSGSSLEFAGEPRSHLARLNGGSTSVLGFFDFPEPLVSVSESAGTANLRIRRVGMTNDPATVECLTADGTARAGTDYQPAADRLTFAPGELEKTVTIPIVNDSAYRGNRTFEVHLQDLTTGTRGVTAGIGLVNIIEDDPGLSFSRTNYWVYGGMLSTNGMPYQLESLQRHGDLSVPLTVQCQVSAGTAVSGVDFVPTNFTLVFTANTFEVLVPVPLIRNDQADSDRSVVLSLSSPSPAVSLESDCVAMVTVLGPPTLPPHLLRGASRIDEFGCFCAGCYLRPGQQMLIEASENLVDWTYLTWIYLDPNSGLSPVFFQDPDAWKYPGRYYRMPVYAGPSD